MHECCFIKSGINRPSFALSQDVSITKYVVFKEFR
jgi:hypothetical protein